MRRVFKHIITLWLIVACCFTARSFAETSKVDLLAAGQSAWQRVDPGWSFADGKLSGTTKLMDGAKTDPAASTFLVSRTVFGGDVIVSLDIVFQAGRYLGVYLDFDQDSQTGIWMATGHALAEDAADNEIERAYIKTVEDSSWVVRATGELIVQPGHILRLRFERQGDDYSIYHDENLIVNYRKLGGYAAGPLQIRLTNASAVIHGLAVESDWQRQSQ
ncbi:MAG: hypothetical protein R3192_06355 [Woeseiaceae bacterium]|nr:hypothetical protein [Woeseiaceae bacterium]